MAIANPITCASMANAKKISATTNNAPQIKPATLDNVSILVPVYSARTEISASTENAWPIPVTTNNANQVKSASTETV